MWEQYQRTFLRMQMLIALISACVFIAADHRLQPAVMFFLAMQGFSLFGAMWAMRLRRKLATTHTERY